MYAFMYSGVRGIPIAVGGADRLRYSRGNVELEALPPQQLRH